MAYKDIINNICNTIHTGLINFNEPRSEASMPTQASSEFITNKQQGDWAEDVLFRAINDNSENIVAVRYGKSDDLVAGDAGFEKFFNEYQAELDTIGKRPDILLFKKEVFDASLGYDISAKPSNEIGDYVAKAIAGIEVRSSAFLINKYTEEANRVVRENTERAIEIKNIVLAQYIDLLEQKRPELIAILQQLDEVSVRTLDFRAATWRSSQRLQELSAMLSEIKKCLKAIQKRNSLSITPKVEDLKVVYKWIMTYNVPHFYVQVFFDKVYGVSFQHILELVSNPDLEGVAYSVITHDKDNNKSEIEIKLNQCWSIGDVKELPTMFTKETSNKKASYTCFEGGKIAVNINKLTA